MPLPHPTRQLPVHNELASSPGNIFFAPSIIAHKQHQGNAINAVNLNLIKTLDKILHAFFENKMVDLSELLIAKNHCNQEVLTNGLVSTRVIIG